MKNIYSRYPENFNTCGGGSGCGRNSSSGSECGNGSGGGCF